MPEQNQPCILLSSAFGEATQRELAGMFPEATFALLAEDGTVPAGAGHARALFRKSLSHEALHTALDGAPGLEWIHTASAGFNWVLTPRVAASGIQLTRSTQAHYAPIAEFAVALALALKKRLPAFFASQQAREWKRPPTLGTLAGGTASILGAGAIGREAARLFRLHGMRTLGSKRTPEPLPEFDEILSPDDLPRLLAEADVLVIACPLTPETQHLIGREQLALMRSSAVLVNIARGPIVVEADLVDALERGVIAGAGLDVFDTEPLLPENPLWGTPNTIVTPHVSYLADEDESVLLQEFAGNLRRFLAGEPLLNTIRSRELGY